MNHSEIIRPANIIHIKLVSLIYLVLGQMEEQV